MTHPIRIQRRRTKGWKIPPNTKCVTRPGPFGNPFRIGGFYKFGGLDPRNRFDSMMLWMQASPGHEDSRFTKIETAAQAVEWYRELLKRSPLKAEDIKSIRGFNLACFCPIGSPCHADFLLEIANK